MSSKLTLGISIGATLAGSFGASTKEARKLVGNVDTSLNTLKKQKINIKQFQQLQRYGKAGERGVKTLGATMKRTKIDTSNLDREAKKLNKTMVELRKVRFIDFKIGQTKKELGGLKQEMLAIAGMGFGAKKLYGGASNTIKAQGEIKTLGISDTGVDAITKSGHEMAMKFGQISAPEYIKASYDIKSGIASLSEDGVNHFTKLAATTAIATKSTTAEMTKLNALGYGIFRKDFKSDEEFGEQFNGAIATAVQMFRTDGSDLAQGFSNIGASASSMGVTLSEQLAIIGVAKSSFNSASEAATGYRAFLDNVGKAQEELGIRLTNSSGRLLEMPEVLETIQGRFSDLSDVSQSDELKKAFGSAEAVKFIKGLINNTQELSNAKKDLDKNMSLGSQQSQQMAEMAKQGHGLERLGNSMSYIGYTIGKVLEPVFNTLADSISWVAKGIAWLDNKIPALIPTLTGLTFGVASVVLSMKAWRIGTLLLHLGKLALLKELRVLRIAIIRNSKLSKLGAISSKLWAGATSILTGTLKILGGAFKFVGKSILWVGRALLMNPIGLAITGIALAAFAIYKYWKPIKAFFSGLWQGITKGLSPVIDTFKQSFEPVVPIFSAISAAISGVIEWFAELFPSVKSTSEELESVASAGANVGLIIGKCFSFALTPVTTLFKAIGWAASTLPKFTSSLWSEIKTAFDGGIGDIGKLIVNWSPLGLFYKAFAGVFGWFGVELPNDFTAFGSNIINKISSAVSNFSPLELFKNAFNSVMTWFGELPSEFGEFGKNIVNSMTDGITNLLPNVSETISNLGGSVIGWFKSKLGINSPSKVFTQLGTEIPNGLTVGISNTEDKAKEAVNKLGDGVTDSFDVELSTQAKKRLTYSEQLRNKQQVQQHNKIYVTINNPKKELDLQQAITAAMKPQAASAGIPLIDMDY